MLAFLLILLTFCILHFYQYFEHYKLAWKLKGPFALPVIGNALHFINLKNVTTLFDYYAKNSSSPFRLWMGPTLVVYIGDAENAELVLKSKDCLEKAKFIRKIIKDILQVDGLFTVTGKTWSSHRRIIGPNLSESSVRPHFAEFNEIVLEVVNKLPTNGETFDILDDIVRCSLIMFIRASFGEPKDKAQQERYISSYHKIWDAIPQKFYQPLYYIDAFWNLTQMSKDLNHSVELGHKMFAEMLNEKIAGRSKGDAFLDKLFDASAKLSTFTHEDIKSETMTVAGAATDTSALTAASLILMLGMHPDSQEKVFQEVLSLMPDKNSTLNFDDLGKFTYLEQCLNETMRLFPPVTAIPRESEKPFVLKDGTVVPPKVPLVVGVRQIQREEKHWGPNTNLFDPTRFEKERMKDISSASFIPFSYGPRNCAGIPYAKVAMKCVVCNLIRRFRIETPYKTPDDLVIIPSINFRFEKGHLVRLIERSQ